jgi:hypothetical protein
MRYRILVLISLSALLAALSLSCSLGGSGLSRTTATPTKTARALTISTLTPTPSPSPRPSDTPLPTGTPQPPADTPAPTATQQAEVALLPSETPLPADTLVPTDLPLPTDTPIPANTPVPPSSTPAPPANTPKPAATKTPPPPTATPKPAVDFRVKEIVAREDGSLGRTGFHNIYFTVIDAGGSPLDNIVLEEVNNQPSRQLVTGEKGPGRVDFFMDPIDYRFKVAANTSGQAFSSEVTHQLSFARGHPVYADLIAGGICPDEPTCRSMEPMHFSYWITFQRTW